MIFISSSAGLPVQGQSPLSGLQLPAALRAGLLCFPHHPQGKMIKVIPFLVYFICWCIS